MSNRRRFIATAIALTLIVGAGAIGYATFLMTPQVRAADSFGTAFTLTDDRGEPITEKALSGHPSLVYFGYTHCPDECPTTLANLANALRDLGPRANDVRVLFVSVDPQRDTLPILKAYVSTFAPQIDGLRGTDDQIAALARRYRVLYRVTPASAGQDSQVMHSDSTFFFDPSGHARFVTTRTDDPQAIAGDIQRLSQI